ncbi:hypothetical protein [Halobacillus sp. KGW1]|uniref:hypothetical protein n=1 Tax=Halobacillus sp. KGW1 TaxID=1793726 RepID=UPI00078210B4|nr:hypothetical protein [Halobacillus sp. KGW1]
MFKNPVFKNVLFKWMPHKEQNICEKKLEKVMKRLKIDDYHFNWDRNSCFIEFAYQGEPYRLEHSIEKAKERGIILRNGLDCLNELTQSLEELCVILDRGIYKFEMWITGMRLPTAKPKDVPEFQEEFHIRYKSTGTQAPPEFQKNEENLPFQNEFEEEAPNIQRHSLK